MKLYEVMYIIKPDLEGEALDEAIAKVNMVMEKEGSIIEQVKKIGKRRLAYEIDDYRDGYYVLLNIQAEPGIVPALEHFFRVTEDYLRYLVTRLNMEKQSESVEAKKDDEKDVNNGHEESVVAEEAEIVNE